MLPSSYHPICSILLSSYIHSPSCLYHYLLHLISSLSWVDDSSHLGAKEGSHITPSILSFGIDSEILVWEVVSWVGFHVGISDLREFVNSLYLYHWSSIYWWSEQAHSKKRKKEKIAMICLCMVSCSIGHLYHLLRSIYEMYLSLWVLVIFSWVFTHWATLVMLLECRGFMWEFYEILCFFYQGWYVLGMRDEKPQIKR